MLRSMPAARKRLQKGKITSTNAQKAKILILMGPGEAWRPLRVSAKMATARPEDIPESLRANFLSVLQSPWAEHTLQGAIRPGCLHLILAALELVGASTLNFSRFYLELIIALRLGPRGVSSICCAAQPMRHHASAAAESWQALGLGPGRHADVDCQS